MIDCVIERPRPRPRHAGSTKIVPIQPTSPFAVPTPDGTVSIEIPAGTQNGQRFRLRKRGLPLLGGGGKGRGDLWVEVKVVMPAVADDASRELLSEFARRNPQDVRQDLMRFAGAKA